MPPSAGLDAFATEAPPPEAAVPLAPAARPASRLPVIVLTAIVLLQSVPTALWLRARFTRPEASGSSAPAQPMAAAALPAAFAPTAPCEPAAADPVPAAGAQAAPVRPERTAAPAVAAAAPPAMVAGMIAVATPVPMRIFSRGRLVGTTEAESIMLPVGNHELEFVNDSVGYRARRTVSVQAGRTSTVRLEAPSGTLHVNAVPWAEVWIDNQRIGETPIGNFQAAIGTRQLTFRHPELGERRATVLVTLKEPARISMDLRKK